MSWCGEEESGMPELLGLRATQTSKVAACSLKHGKRKKDGKQIRAKKEKGKVNYSLKMHARFAPPFSFYTSTVPHPTYSSLISMHKINLFFQLPS
jgi:hypothetical protein